MAMAVLELKQYTFHYPDQREAALKRITFTVEAGEFIVLVGPAGSGKTTLLRHIKRELAPAGEASGEICVGRSLSGEGDQAQPFQIGMVMQDPDNQIVTEQVQQELAFALENAGVPLETMRRRIAEMSHFFGLEPLLYQDTDALSGGQKQIVNLASVLLMQPAVLLLDEPAAQLDPIAAQEFFQLVQRLNREFGMTVLISEHRLEDVFPMADRVIVMERGEIRYDGPPREVVRRVWMEEDNAFRSYLPSVARLYLHVEGKRAEAERMPLTVKEGRSWLNEKNKIPKRRLDENDRRVPDVDDQRVSGIDARRAPDAEDRRISSVNDRLPLLSCRDVVFSYGKHLPFVLKNTSFDILPQEFTVLLGGNGSGKSTLLRLAAGLLKPRQGTIRYGGRPIHRIGEPERYRRCIGYLAQNPMAGFAHDTVMEELIHAAAFAGLRPAQEEAEKMLHVFQLEAVKDRHPYDLSGGEKQLAALAAVLLSQPELLLIDEPTKGLDPNAKRRLGERLAALHQNGLTIFMATHDVEFAARYAGRCMMLFDGGVTGSEAPGPFFRENYFYTTTANRLFRGWIPGVLHVEDVWDKW